MGRKPPTAGLNGTSPEIPNTVDADPYATAGKATATARPGERGPASTGASAVGTQGREAHGTREILSSPRQPAVDLDPKGNRRGEDRRGEVGSAHSTADTRESLGEGRGRQTSASAARRMAGTQRPSPMSQALRRLARKAKEEPQTQFTAMAHLLTAEVYWAAWRRLKKGASTGVDGVTATAYAAHLADNLRALQARVQAKQYRPQPVRRVHLPKAGGGTRPIGIPAPEDKLVQGAVRLVPEALYEQDFLPCSYGFRPQRSPHQALTALEQALVRQKVSYVLDIDIKRCFDSLDRAHLMRFVQHRVKDRSILRLLRGWLRAGVQEDGGLVSSKTGTPQGGVISPLLANISLHDALDLWAERRMRKTLRGALVLVRYADDVVVGFQYRDDAEAFQQALAARLHQFGLELNTAKTRLLEFGRFAQERAARHGRKPETFDFLGFTHICGRTRRGAFAVRRKTSRTRLRRVLTATGRWCKVNRHVPVRAQWAILSGKLRGHYQHYGVAGNRNALQGVYTRVVRAGRQWLNRRSQRARMHWRTFTALLRRYPLPRPVLMAVPSGVVQGVLF